MKVYACTGLTSRCITLAHAYYLLKFEGGGQKSCLTIIWPIDAECGIHFREVFAQDMFADIDFKVVEIDLLEKTYFDSHKSDGVRLNITKGHYIKAMQALILILLNMFQKHKRKWKAQRVNQYIQKKKWIDYMPPAEIGWSGDSYIDYTRDRWRQVVKDLENHKEVCVRAYCGIIKDERSREADLSVIKFKNNYWQCVEEIIKANEKYIGVHIRRTDHSTAIKESRTEDFAVKIDEMLDKNEKTKIFLATDDVREEEKLREIYGERLVVQQNKAWGRRTEEEMKAGIIDCLCLTRCECILGSCGSVYSSFAAQYGGKRLIVCREEANGGKK